jgi:DNA-binding CsgD family transcriptional regulator
MLIKTMARVLYSPEFRSVSQAIQAYERGDGTPLRDLVEEKVGRRDATGFSRLSSEVKIYGEDLPVSWVLREYLPVRRARLKSREEAAQVEELYPKARRGVRTSYPRLEAVIEHHRTLGQPFEEALKELLLGTLYLERAEGTPDNRLGAEAANAISRSEEGPLRSDKPGLVVVEPDPNSEPFQSAATGDPEYGLTGCNVKRMMRPEVLDATGEAIADAELLHRLVGHAGLSSQEQEVIELAIYGYRNKDIAECTNIGEKQVSVVKDRAMKKLRRELSQAA